MAKSSGLQLTLIFVAALAMASRIRSEKEERILNSIPRQFTVYFQERFFESIIPVAGPSAFNQFGAVFVGSIPVTKEISNTSQVIGHAEGLSAVCSLNNTNGSQRCLYFSLFFEQGEYKGSSLQIQGILNSGPTGINVGEVAVNSGTENFRRVKGYAHVQTILQTAPNVAVSRFIITIKYD